MPPPPAPAAPRTQRPLPYLALLAAAAVAGTLLIGHLLWQARVEAIEGAQTSALNYARTMQVRLDATFRRTDAVVQAMARSTPLQALEPGAEAMFGPRVNGELAALARAFEELIALRIVDAQGEQRYASTPGVTARVNYADRDFFKRLQAEPNNKLVFSEVVTGRLSGRPTMVIAYPIRAPGGELAGAVLAPMDLSFFQRQFQQLDIGKQGVVFLRRTDGNGAMVLRWPHIEAEVNSPMPATHVIWKAMSAGQSEALSQYRAFTDGVERMSGTVRVQGYPFFLTVAMSRQEVLAGWRRLAWATGGIWLALLAAMSVLVWRVQQAERTRLSLEQQLLESRRIESLGTLAGGIAHDFNNILAAIIGNVALARRELDGTHPAVGSLEQVRTAAARGRTLVQQILAIGRRQPQALAQQPLLPLLEETAALLRPTLPASVQMQVQPDLAPVHAAVDAARLQQVLMNLCTNASHAMQGRSGCIEIGLSARAAPLHALRPDSPLAGQRCAHLWVRDEGAGMDAATQARIFEPFFTTKPSGEGTGLGLPVVQGIVAAHGGEIAIDSAPGQGTTVHVYLPLTEPQPAAHGSTAEATAPMPAAPAPAPLPSGAVGQRVLYIDDDPVVALMVERLLGQAGYRAEVQGSGTEALQRLRGEPGAFDIVITDYNMPGLSGLDVARELADLCPGTPVYISSGYITEELLSKAQAAGVRGVLQKQNTLEDLLPMLQGRAETLSPARP